MEIDDKRVTATEVVEQMKLKQYQLEREYALKQALQPLHRPLNPPLPSREQQAGIAVNDLWFAIDKLIDWAINAKSPMGDMGPPRETLEEIKVFFRKLKWLVEGDYSSGYASDKSYQQQVENMKNLLIQNIGGGIGNGTK